MKKGAPNISTKASHQEKHPMAEVDNIRAFFFLKLTSQACDSLSRVGRRIPIQAQSLGRRMTV